MLNFQADPTSGRPPKRVFKFIPEIPEIPFRTELRNCRSTPNTYIYIYIYIYM